MCEALPIGRAGRTAIISSSFACRLSERTVRGTVLSSGVQPAGGGVLGGLGVAAGNLLRTMSGLNGIGSVWRKAKRMVVRLSTYSRMVLSPAKNSSSLKSEQPVRVAASTASARKCL